MSAAIDKYIKTIDITIVKEIRDYSNHPLVKKKAEEAKAFIKKHGLPDFKGATSPGK